MFTNMQPWLKILFVATALLVVMAGIALGLPSPQQSDQRQDPAKPATPAQVTPEYAEALRARAAELDRREKELLRREQELAFLEQDLIKRLNAVEADKKAFQAEKKTWEDNTAKDAAERDSERVVKIANAFKAMKADVAADQLIALYRENRATSLYVLSRIDDKSIGKIFSKMPDPVIAARILEDLKMWRVRDEADLVVSQ